MTSPLTDEALIQAATVWRDEDPDPATRAEVDALLAARDLPELRARFDDRLQFGTAGLRGPMGAGPNRMNRALVRRATAGVAAWLLANGRTGRVVVGRDARHGSAEMAADTAAVLAGAGLSVLAVPHPLPTPVTAFAIRHVGATAGIMITASHNPAVDNGYKLYLGDGAQIVPPVDGQISAHIDAVGSLREVPLAPDGVQTLGPELLDAYLDAVLAVIQVPPSSDLISVYTAMHGVGAETVRAAFSRTTFPIPLPVAAQIDPDPDFPTVAFPNPEEPGALDLSLALARGAGADLVLANDPDADRLAVAVPDPAAAGGWRPLTGDELGALLADHLLRTRPHHPNDVMVTTVVSSRLLANVTAAGGVGYAEALTGFKWVVRAPAADQRFLFGYEEALGYSVGEVVRDKDGISAALLTAELAATLKASGSTMLDRLADIFREHGVHVTRQRAVRLGGTDWLARVTNAMAAVRAAPPARIGGRSVEQIEDLLIGHRLPPSDVLIFTLDGARLVIRPSGTEAKVKCYVEVVTSVTAADDVWQVRVRASEQVDALLDAAADLLAEHGI